MGRSIGVVRVELRDKAMALSPLVPPGQGAAGGCRHPRVLHIRCLPHGQRGKRVGAWAHCSGMLRLACWAHGRPGDPSALGCVTMLVSHQVIFSHLPLPCSDYSLHLLTMVCEPRQHLRLPPPPAA